MTTKGVRRAVRGLANVPSDSLSRELARRQKVASELEVKHANLLAEVADLEREIRECGGNVNGATADRGNGKAGRPRGGRSSTLPQALAQLLKGKTMSVTDAAEAVQRAGYATKSPNFRVIVNAALLREKALFKRKGRGLYTAK